MHFRIRKNVIQLIRTTYDGSKKKGTNDIIGSVSLSKPEISEELRSKLTEAETAAFQAWLDTQHKTKMLREEIAALSLADTLALAEKWFERENPSTASQLAAQDATLQWQSLRKVFAKKGLLD
jgi:hypothetical protein